MNKAEELQVGLAIIEASLIDSIKDHTKHEDPIILEPYDSWEVKGDRLTVFTEDEFSDVLNEIGDMNVLEYCAEQQRVHGLISAKDFVASDAERKFIALDESAGIIFGLVNIEKPAIAKLDDRGFWGFFQGDGEKYFFSRGQHRFSVDRVQLK